MYNRSTLLPTSSKSISTSTTLRQRSPSIKVYQSFSSRQSSPFKATPFIDNNINHLTSLKQLIINEQNIVSSHKEWFSITCEKIDKHFQGVSSDIENFLNQQKLKIRKSIQKEYCQFLKFIKEVKTQIKAFYSCKNNLQSQKILSIAKKMESQNSEYYSGQDLNARTVFDQENAERQKFKEINNFYSQNQNILEQLSSKARQHLGFRQKLQQKSGQFEFILDKFRQTIDYSIAKMVQCCNSFIRNDFINQ